MEVNKKKHQIEVGVAPLPQGYRADPVEEQKRKNFTEWSEKNYPKEDRINHPSHYAWLKTLCGIEPVDICRHLNFNVGNAIKYLLRKDKEDIISLRDKRIEDLKKAVWYINDEIKRLENGNN